MTPDELQALLAPIRLPAEFATFGPRDGFVALLIGILVGMAARQVLRPLFIARERPGVAARRRIATLARSPLPERILGLASLLRSLDPDRKLQRPDGLNAALYDPRGTMDPAVLERAILDAARTRERRA